MEAVVDVEPRFKIREPRTAWSRFLEDRRIGTDARVGPLSGGTGHGFLCPPPRGAWPPHPALPEGVRRFPSGAELAPLRLRGGRPYPRVFLVPGSWFLVFDS
jgi:hypothetical protein